MFRTMTRSGVAMLLLALASLALPQLWAAPDVVEPREIANFRPALEGAEFGSWTFFALSTTGKAAAIKDYAADEVEIWDVRRGRRSSVLTLPSPKKRSKSNWSGETELAFSASGQTLVARDIAANQRLGKRLRIWTPLASGSSAVQIPLSSHVYAVSPDGRLVAGLGKGDKPVRTYNGTTTLNAVSSLNIWDTKTGEAVARIPFAKKAALGLTWSVGGMVFTPDGKELILDDSGEEPGQRRLVAFDVTPATATPSAAAGRVIARDIDSEQPIVYVHQNFSQATMSFLNGGKTLVTLSKKRDKRTNVRQWQIHYWDMVAGGEQRPAATFFTNAFSSDLQVVSPYGDVLALTMDESHRIRGLIRIVDLATGKTRAEIAFRAGVSVNSLFVDAAGKHLAAQTSDNRLHVWELGPPQAGDSPPPTSLRGAPK